MQSVDENTHLPSELFGFVPTDKSREAEKHRRAWTCPFMGSRCIKVLYRTDQRPIGTCSAFHLGTPNIICPKRFLESDKRVIKEVATRALGDSRQPILIPEVKLPRISNSKRLSRYGQVDWVALTLDKQVIHDFVGIEIVANQTTSTGELTDAAREFERTGKFSKDHYSYGLNTYMQIKTFFTQCLAKGRLFKHWNKKYAWLMQDVMFENWLERFSLNLGEGVEHGDFIFPVYDLVFNSVSERYELKLKNTYSATYDELLEAYSGTGRGRDLPPVQTFTENLRKRLSVGHLSVHD